MRHKDFSVTLLVVVAVAIPSVELVSSYSLETLRADVLCV